MEKTSKKPQLNTVYQSDSQPTDKKFSQETEVTFLNLNQINVNPYQPRQKINESDLSFLELTNSIITHGILEPLVVAKTPAGYHLIAGERRWRAAKKAGLTKIPVHLIASTPRQMLEMALLENIQREDLAPLEKSRALNELKNRYHLTVKELASRLSRTTADIYGNLSLLELPDPIKDGLTKKLITESDARLLVTIKTERDRLNCYQQMLDTDFSSLEKRELISQYSQKNHPKTSNSFINDEKIRRLMQRNKNLTQQIQKKLKSHPTIKISEKEGTSRITIVLKGDNSDRHQDLKNLLVGLGLNPHDEIPDPNI